MNLKQVSYALAQPTIQPLFDTKQFQDVLLSWTGNSQTYYDAIQENWSESILGSSKWNKVLHDGFLVVENSIQNNYQRADLAVEASVLAAAKSTGLELVLYTKTGMGDGQQANNPWLQELPDPITRSTTWDNYITVSKLPMLLLQVEHCK